MRAPVTLILRGGDVVTGDPSRPRVRALAVSGDRIVAAGDDAGVSALGGPTTRVIELGGRTVLPALTDAHAHLYGLGLALDQVDLRACRSPEDCAGRVRAALAGRPAGEWILGRGWDQNRFPGGAFPGHQPLDAAAPGRAVWLARIDGHAGWANAEALTRAGVTRATADPPGGRIERDRDGQPTGVLVDEAMELVERVIPAPSAEARERAILRAQALALERGLTEIHEMGIDAPTIATYRALETSGQLVLRVYAFVGGDTRVLAHPPVLPSPGARFTLRGIKLYADGALGSRGAALLAPYSDDPKNQGLVVSSPQELDQAARAALAHGWQVAVHAIGDRGNRMVLDAFERAGCSRAADHRFRIEHAQVVSLVDIPRFAALGVIASMQPTHATSDMPWAEARLGRERLAGAYAWRRFLSAGVRLALGSDFPVEEVEPISGGLWAAVTRTDGEGSPPGGWLPAERLTLEEAIRGFTSDAAFAAFEEAWRGRGAVGQVADLTVLDRSLTGMSVQVLRQARVWATVVGGRVVFDRP
jgi:predicted amidohydrolase YtcJ